MKKPILLIIAALITAWSAMAAEPMPDKNWIPDAGPVTYNTNDVINIQITGTGHEEYDRLELNTGTLFPGGASLNVFPCYTPTPGDRFVIFKAPAISGEFSNDELINAGGKYFILSYEKEGSIDVVVLTAVARLLGLYINTTGT